MLLLPVVLPSGWCTFCNNDPDAVVRGYNGCCPYCDPTGAAADAELRAVRAEDAEREALRRKDEAEEDAATARDDLRDARAEIERLTDELAKPQRRSPMEH